MIDKLRMLDDATFYKLREAMDDEHKRRLSRLIGIGKQVTFEAKGRTVRLLITGRGPKNLMGHEIDENGRHEPFKKWRVSPNALTPYQEPAKPVITKGAAADRPATLADGAF